MLWLCLVYEEDRDRLMMPASLARARPGLERSGLIKGEERERGGKGGWREEGRELGEREEGRELGAREVVGMGEGREECERVDVKEREEVKAVLRGVREALGGWDSWDGWVVEGGREVEMEVENGGGGRWEERGGMEEGRLAREEGSSLVLAKQMRQRPPKKGFGSSSRGRPHSGEGG